MPLFDTHCHLQDERIIDQVDTILSKAGESEVTGFLCCGSGIDDWHQVKTLSEKYNAIVPAFGVHPHFIEEQPQDWYSRLKEYHRICPAVVGEIGLDLHFIQTPIDLQLEFFEKQLQLAVELKRPVSLHCVKAWQHLLPALKKYSHPDVNIQVHSYGGGPGLVEELLKLNCYFSFSCSLTRPRNKKSHEAVKIIPRDRILIETDAPDIPPMVNGKIDYKTPNEPANLPLVLNEAARLLEINLHQLDLQLHQNTKKFLGQLLN